MNQFEQRVKDRVAGKEASKPIVELALEILATLPSIESQAAFYDELKLRLRDPITHPKLVAKRVMNEAQAREFGKRLMPYGAHKWTPINEVPISYLLSITEDSKFIKELRAYLVSPSVQAEQPDA